jgi:spermidine synthase
VGSLIQRELLGSAQVPGGPEMRLFRHDRDFMIVLGGNELMSTRMNGSEIALAEGTCARLPQARKPRLLIGGYGMGFTLRAALAALGPEADVVVVELVPQIIEWARRPMRELAAGCLDDPRVTVILGDVADEIRGGPNGYDAILLDVDNGPEGLTAALNDELYSPRGLRLAKTALRPGGVLAVWSAARDKAFAARLRKAGFAVEEVTVRARANGKGPKHVIWFARVG